MAKELGRIQVPIPSAGQLTLWVLPHYKDKGVVRVFCQDRKGAWVKKFTFTAEIIVAVADRYMEVLREDKSTYEILASNRGPYGKRQDLRVIKFNDSHLVQFDMIIWSGDYSSWNYQPQHVLEILGLLRNAATKIRK